MTFRGSGKSLYGVEASRTGESFLGEPPRLSTIRQQLAILGVAMSCM